MVSRLCRAYAKWLSLRAPPQGLAVFRAAYAAVMIGDVWQMFAFRRLIFEPLPFETAGEIDPTGLLLAWLAALICLAVGWQTRAAAAVNFACSLLTLATFRQYEYHLDHLAHGINLLLVFLPVAEVWSVDAWLRHRQVRPILGRASEHPGIHPLNVFALLLIGLGLPYLDSCFWKLGQESWLSGLGVWHFASLPHNTWVNPELLQHLLNRQWLMTAANYATLGLEAGFIFLMWSRRCRAWLLLPIGTVLHVGIVVAFPIPFFALVMLALYALVVPAEWWNLVFKQVFGKSTADHRSAGEGEAQRGEFGGGQQSKGLSIAAFQIWTERSAHPRNKQTATGPVTAALVWRDSQLWNRFCQAITSLVQHGWQSVNALFASGTRPQWRTHRQDSAAPTPHRLAIAVLENPADESHPGEKIPSPRNVDCYANRPLYLAGLILFLLIAITMQAAMILENPLCFDREIVSADWKQRIHLAAGICPHGVFLDHHFRGYDHILAVVRLHNDGTQEWLPLTNSAGQMERYAIGRLWAKWAYRANNPYMLETPIRSAIRDYTAYWLHEQNRSLDRAQFLILVKAYEPVNGWEKNKLRRQTEQPWQMAGNGAWSAGKFTCTLHDLESVKPLSPSSAQQVAAKEQRRIR